MIKDIEPLEQITDFSLYFTLALTIFAVVLIYFIVKNLLSKKLSIREITLKKYKDINFENPKQTAYELTKYSNILAKGQKAKEIKTRLIKNLEKYKYKKSIPKFDEETKSLYNLFLEVVENE